MEPFTVHQGRAVALRRSNVDTDQIIPASYLKRITRTGFADGLFAAWRAEEDFVLNSPAAAGASILVTGPDFGIGSSREHAVWALLDYGFRVVIAERFGDIFRGNATKAGLLPVVLSPDAVAAISDAVDAEPATELTVDLVQREVWLSPPGGQPELAATFGIDDYTRWRLMEGHDDISLTLRHTERISDFERSRPAWLPVAG